MEIEIIKIDNSQADENIPDLSSTKYFALIMSKTLIGLRMLHWYTDNFNFHTIIGDLYETLDPLFDKFLEEIIGTSKSFHLLFPSFSPNCINLDDLLELNNEISLYIDFFNRISTILKAYLNSPELQNYILSSPSGLNNTKEEILSAFNKASYLLEMIPTSK